MILPGSDMTRNIILISFDNTAIISQKIRKTIKAAVDITHKCCNIALFGERFFPEKRKWKAYGEIKSLDISWGTLGKGWWHMLEKRLKYGTQ